MTSEMKPSSSRCISISSPMRWPKDIFPERDWHDVVKVHHLGGGVKKKNDRNETTAGAGLLIGRAAAVGEEGKGTRRKERVERESQNR